MDLRTFWETWRFFVHHASDGQLNLYLERGDAKVSRIGNAGTLNTWDSVPEAFSIYELTIYPRFPKVTAYAITERHISLLNEYAPIEGQTWIKQDVCTAVPVVITGGGF